jgi:hypothetical protein
MTSTDRWEGRDANDVAVELEAVGEGDGLPVVVPTRHNVRAMLAADDLTGAERLGRIPPLGPDATSEAVAIQAVIAGCRPGHLAVVLAAIQAIQNASFNALGVFTTTGSAACAVIVNGPAAARLGFNGGHNCLGPGNRSNAAVGRALGLVVRNLGRAIPGVTDMATMGQPGKYSFCFAENEADSPWEPLHVERGVAGAASAVTVHAAAGTTEVVNSFERDSNELLESLALSLASPSSIGRAGETVTIGGGQPLVLMSPEWAAICARDGLSKADVKRELWRRARFPVARLPQQLRDAVVAQRGRTGEPAESDLPIASGPDRLLVVVAGGVGVKQTVVPGWNGGSQAVTVAIRTPGLAIQS